MKKGKYAKKTPLAKSLAVILAVVMLIGGVVGGTVAWLTDNTGAITNTFTVGNIDITLQEHDYDPEKDELDMDATAPTGNADYKMIPGWTIPKDPWVTVSAESEDCYLFIKVEEKGGIVAVDGTTYGFDDFIDYKISEDWTELTAGLGIYYKKIDNADKKGEATKHTILAAGPENAWAEDQVLTKTTVTKEMMDALVETPAQTPQLVFTAYAVQLYKTNKPATGDVTAAQFTPAEAWAKVSGSTTVG